MTNRRAGSRFPTFVACLALLVSQLACLTGIDAIDEELFPKEYHEKKREQADREMFNDIFVRPFLERSLQEASKPQGEFVAPVAPVAPQVQSAAPQTQPQQPAPVSGVPVILKIDYPSTIPPDGQVHYGWISFTDAGGDVSKVNIEQVWGTTSIPGCLCDTSIDGPPTAGRAKIGFT